MMPPETGNPRKANPEVPAPSTERLDPIAVENAGLVMVAPLFEPLFRRCGLIDYDGIFVDCFAAQRAVHLLKHLADPGFSAPEHSIALNKLLCGLDPWDAPVPEVELTDTEKAAVLELLEHVSAHWPSGGGKSPTTIRTSYLCRPGRLQQRDERGWSLRVQRRGWDVDLPELPWSFGIIHRAWMPHPLNVEWL